MPVSTHHQRAYAIWKEMTFRMGLDLFIHSICYSELIKCDELRHFTNFKTINEVTNKLYPKLYICFNGMVLDINLLVLKMIVFSDDLYSSLELLLFH